jgi:hypothetical protein
VGFEITRGQLYSEDPDFVRRVIDCPPLILVAKCYSRGPAGRLGKYAGSQAVRNNVDTGVSKY